MKNSKYEENKSRIRDEAIEWQLSWAENCYSYQEVAEKVHYFYKNGKRYGLLKEFRENAII